MKTILKKLTVSRVILTRIIFIALFFTVTTAVPTHKAEADIFSDIGDAIGDAFDGGGFGGSGDTHCTCSHDDYVNNGGTGGNDNSGGGSGGTGSFVNSNGTTVLASGFTSAEASALGRELEAEYEQQFGGNYSYSTNLNADGTYDVTVTENNNGGNGGNNSGSTQIYNFAGDPPSPGRQGARRVLSAVSSGQSGRPRRGRDRQNRGAKTRARHRQRGLEAERRSR